MAHFSLAEMPDHRPHDASLFLSVSLARHRHSRFSDPYHVHAHHLTMPALLVTRATRDEKRASDRLTIIIVLSVIAGVFLLALTALILNNRRKSRKDREAREAAEKKDPDATGTKKTAP